MNSNDRGDRPGGSISNWTPATEEEVVGNRKLKLALVRFLTAILAAVFLGARKFPLPPLLISGLSRTGKTSIVRQLVRWMTCELITELIGELCNRTCRVCADRVDLHGEFYIPSFLRMRKYGRTIQVHYKPIDCSRLNSRGEVEALLSDIREIQDRSDRGIVVVFLDEAHRLKNRQLDEMFLKPIEDFENVWWLFGTAGPEELDGMLRNRLTELRTESPDEKELYVWLIRRCQQFDIPYEIDGIMRICEKSNHVPGIALKALVLAEWSPGGVTLAFAENEWEAPSFS